jgi:precorrin-6A/cobalt-precorrin-6A reductase
LPAPDKPVLILGGTAEAAELAARLTDRGLNVITSLAGRTREPAVLKGKTRTGGFGGAEGLAYYMQENHIALLIDMTHPFATQMSANARTASSISGIKLLAWQRPQWNKMEGDQWQEVTTIPAAITAIPSGAHVLLALGHQHITPFAARADVHFLVRMINQPSVSLDLPDHHLVLAKPGSLEEEFATLRNHAITHIVCRNSGGKASYTKIAAARLLGLPVIMIVQDRTIGTRTSFNAVLEEIFAFLP